MTKHTGILRRYDPRPPYLKKIRPGTIGTFLNHKVQCKPCGGVLNPIRSAMNWASNSGGQFTYSVFRRSIFKTADRRIDFCIT